MSVAASVFCLSEEIRSAYCEIYFTINSYGSLA